MRNAAERSGQALLVLCSLGFLTGGCALISRSTLSTVKSGYSFLGKTIGLCVILDGEEQEAISEGRVARRTIASAESEGYAADALPAAARADAGIVMPPAAVTSLDARLEHSQYYDDELTHPMIEQTKAMLERRGYRVEVIGVPSGGVELQELREQARTKGCELIAVETVTLVRSWNVHRAYQSRGGGELSTSFLWQLYVGGLVLTNMSVFDVASGEVVWQHARRDIPADLLAPILAELYDGKIATERFGARPGTYQTWMYRQSAARALHLMFRTLEQGFVPLPPGSIRADSIAAATRYEAGDRVFVRPLESDILWLPATVVSDRGEGLIQVQWAEGVWPEIGERTTFEPTRVMPEPERMPPIVWVRSRETFEHQPFRFVRVGANGLTYVEQAGDASPKTFLPGRVGIASDLPITEE